MTDEYLSDEELVLITGTKQKARQVKWLVANHWRHSVSGNGRPIVLKSYRDQKLGPIKDYVRKPKQPRFHLIP